MSTTLTYGRKLPDDGDKGSSFFDDLEVNIALNDAHTHNGVDSAPIPIQNLSKSTQAVLSGNWVAVAGQSGTFSQTIVLPSGITMANFIPKFQVDNAGAEFQDIIHPSIKQVTTTSYEIFINDNTLDLLATYG